MTDHDDPLVRALYDLPTGAQRPIETIEHRARSIRHRRRAAAAGAVALAAGILALPSAMPLGGQPGSDLPPATTVPTEEPELSDCELETDARGEYVALDEVPDRLRLLWDESAAPPPDEASMVDFGDAEVTESWLTDPWCRNLDPSEAANSVINVVEVEGDVVTRTVTVLGPSEGSVDRFDHASRVLESAAGPVAVVGSLLGGPYDPGPDREAFEAYWPAGNGRYWSAWVRGPMPDAELVELAESVRLSDGSIDLGGWSGTEDAARVWEPRAEDRPAPAALRTTYNVRVRGSVDLAASDGGSENSLWQQAVVGDRFVDVDGAMGLLSPSESELIWVTPDGVLARLSGADGDELLDIARTVRPVDADDERLIEVWHGPDS